MTERRELANYRRDTFAAEAHLAAAHEPPKEVERVDESDSWPVRWCYCCHSRKRILHELEHCLECMTL